MDVKEKAEQLTAHILDPIERERKKRNLIRALTVVEITPPEHQSEDNGQYDGVPVATIDRLNNRENNRLRILLSKRKELFEVEDEPELTPEEKLNLRGDYGYTPLIQAVINRDLNTIRILLKKGADVNIKDNGGMTAMDKAKKCGEKKILLLLRKFKK